MTGGKDYIIDDTNRELINQIFYYLTMNEKYQGDLNKGILLIGDYGTGKTIIMQIIKYLIHANSDRRVKFIPCSNFMEAIKEKGISYYYKRPIILDELGRETQVVKDYGTERKPMIELLSQRYNYKGWTFATSNFDMKELSDIYGGYVMDRFIEMFNIMELSGKSRRA